MACARVAGPDGDDARSGGAVKAGRDGLDPSRLDVTVTEGERCRRALRVVVPPDVVDAETAAVLRKYASRMKMRGFRKGMVPTRVVLRQFGREIEEEAIRAAVRKACDAAIAANGLHPVSDVAVKDLRYDAGERLAFDASFDVRPEVSLARLGGFRLERPRVDVREEAVDEILELMRRERAAWRTRESGSPVAGDSVTVALTRLEGADDGDEGSREYEITLGEGQALPDIEDAIGTLVPGAAGDFDVRFPDDAADEERRGQRHRLRIQLLSRRVPEPPPLDDAFARSVGDIEDLDALRTRIEEDLETEARARAEAELRDRLIGLVVEANDFEVPESMVEGYVSVVIGDTDGVEQERIDEMRKELRPAATMAVKRDLLMERIVDEHGLRATAEELGAQVDRLARESNQSPGRLRARLKKSGELGRIERTLTDARVFEFLKSRSEITEPQ